MRLLVTAALAVLLAAPPAHARPGDFDPGFANGGRTAYRVGDTGGYVNGLTLLGQRRPVVSVSPTYTGQPTTLTLTAGGRLARRTVFAPPAIGPPWFADGYALTQIGSAPPRYALARIGATQAVAVALPANIGDREPALFGFGVDGAGRAVLTIGYSLGLGKWRTIAVRHLPSGAVDTRYGRNGVALVGNLAAQPTLVKRDGRLYVVAERDHRNTHVIAFDSAGRRLSGFKTRALRSGRFARLGSPSNLIAAPGGRLIVVGADYSRSGWIARLDADGRPDRRFGDHGLLRLRRFTPYDLALDRRGRVILAGTSSAPLSSLHDAAVMRLTARGRRDRTFGAGGMVTMTLGRLRGVRLIASQARFLAVDDRNRIVIGGESYDEDYMDRDDVGFSYPSIARLQG